MTNTRYATEQEFLKKGFDAVARFTEQMAEDVQVTVRTEQRERVERCIYKYTECGAWIQFEPDGITLGSIVEGCDFGTCTYFLAYPFTRQDFDARIDAIETEEGLL